MMTNVDMVTFVVALEFAHGAAATQMGKVTQQRLEKFEEVLKARKKAGALAFFIKRAPTQDDLLATELAANECAKRIQKLDQMQGMVDMNAESIELTTDEYRCLFGEENVERKQRARL